MTEQSKKTTEPLQELNKNLVCNNLSSIKNLTNLATDLEEGE